MNIKVDKCLSIIHKQKLENETLKKELLDTLKMNKDNRNDTIKLINYNKVLKNEISRLKDTYNDNVSSKKKTLEIMKQLHSELENNLNEKKLLNLKIVELKSKLDFMQNKYENEK